MWLDLACSEASASAIVTIDSIYAVCDREIVVQYSWG